MAGPHPVVRVAAELADRGRRSAHQAHVPINLVDEEEVLVGVVERLHAGTHAPVGIRHLADDGIRVELHHRVALCLAHRRDIALQDGIRDFVHSLQEADGQPPVGQLLAAVHRPEAVLEIVVLHAAVLLDLAVAAVVVRKQQAVARNHLARTAGAKEHHGVLERRLVDAVHVLGRQPETMGLHILDALGDQHRQPHSLVRTQRLESGEQRKCAAEYHLPVHTSKFTHFIANFTA